MRIRTMIYLEAELLEVMKTRARSQRVSLAELFRRLAGEYVARPESAGPVPRELHSGLIGLGGSGLHDVSERHDQYIGEAIKSDRDAR